MKSIQPSFSEGSYQVLSHLLAKVATSFPRSYVRQNVEPSRSYVRQNMGPSRSYVRQNVEPSRSYVRQNVEPSRSYVRQNVGHLNSAPHSTCHLSFIALTTLWGAVLIVATSLFAPASAICQSPPSKTELTPAALQIQAASVRLSNREGHFLGCGVVVACGDLEFHVLTAEHIVRAAPQLAVHCFTPGSFIPGPFTPGPGQATELGGLVQHSNVQVVAEDARADLALLLVKSGIPPAGQLSIATADGTSQLSPPFSAWVTDWRGANALKVISVDVARRQLARRDASAQPVSFWELSQPSRPGMSGGGLVSQAGQLLGIASGNSQQHAYYSDETELARFLKKAAPKLISP